MVTSQSDWIAEAGERGNSAGTKVDPGGSDPENFLRMKLKLKWTMQLGMAESPGQLQGTLMK